VRGSPPKTVEQISSVPIAIRPADNPFRADRIDRVRYRPQGFTWDELLNRLRRLDYRAAIEGGYGSGKTRLLKELAARLEERGFRVSVVRIGSESRSFPGGLLRVLLSAKSPDRIVLLDEADRLSAFPLMVLRLLSRRLGGLVVTSHEPGILPLLVECKASPELLDEILAELVGQETDALRQWSRRLFREHGGNMREVLRALYDVYSDK
jgi:hypothetical protein